MDEKYPELYYWMNESESDVVFVVDGQRVPALKHVLNIKSKVFEDMFGSMDKSMDEITIEDMDCEAFKTAIRFLYTEVMVIKDEKDIKTLDELMKVAVKYQIYRLIETINEKFQKVLNCDNLEYYCKTAFELNYKELIPMFQEFMCREFGSLLCYKAMDTLKRINQYTDQTMFKVIANHCYHKDYLVEKEDNPFHFTLDENWNQTKYPELDHLFNESKSDVVFIVDGQRVPALRQVLALKSPVFRAMFGHNFKESKEKEITIEDMNFEAFKVMIDFFYTERLQFNDKSIEFIRHLLNTIDFYQVYRMLNPLEKDIIKLIDINTFDEFAKVAKDFKIGQLYEELKSFIRNNFSKFEDKNMNQLKQSNELMNGYLFEVMVNNKKACTWIHQCVVSSPHILSVYFPKKRKLFK